MKLKKDRSYIIVVFYILLIALLECFFFRELLASPYAMIGDRGDSRLNNLIMEHWFKVFQGLEPIQNLSMFYPVENTLSYTDMLLGTSIPYSILRLFGVNMFLANKLTLVGVHCLGSYSMFYLLKKLLRLNDSCAFLGVLSFSFANGYAIRIGHTQMMALSYVPVLVIFFVELCRHIHDRKWRRLYLLLLATGLALLAYTGWYVTFFLVVFTLVFVICAAVLLWKYQRNVLLDIVAVFKKYIWEFLITVIYLCVIMIPFLMMYLPTSRQFGERSWGEVTLCLPEIFDIFNVSTNNLLLGSIIEKMNLSSLRNRYEHEVGQGFSVFVILLLVVLGYKMCKDFRRRKSEGGITIVDTLYVALLFTTAISIILPIQSTGISLWYIVYRLIPGGSSIRAASRFYFFLLLPIGVMIAYLSKNLIDARKSQKWKAIAFVVLALGIWTTNISKPEISHWEYDEDLKLLSETPAPPKEAQIIAFEDTREAPEASHAIQLDAWLLADHYGLKTVNGYSGQFPHQWMNCFWDVQNVNAGAWAKLQGIEEPIYVYDKATLEWRALEWSEIELLDESLAIHFAGEEWNGNDYIASGISMSEDLFTWTTGEKLELITFQTQPDKEYMMSIQLYSVFSPPQRMIVEVNGDEHELTALNADELQLYVSADDQGLLGITIHLPDAISPHDLGESEDTRALALALTKIAFDAA